MVEDRVVALIPARGGSKGIHKKNIQYVAGKPLIGWTIEQAFEATYIDDLFVSTDDEEIKKVAEDHGASVIDRPKSISGDEASTESALLHASNVLDHNYEIMVLLQCTSPLRKAQQIDEALEKLRAKNADSLLSVYENESFLWKGEEPLNYDLDNRPRRQEKDWELVENGSIYITTKDILLNEHNRLGGKIAKYKMPRWMSFEIDNPFDLELVDYLMRRKMPKTINVSPIEYLLFDVDGIFTDGKVYVDSKGRETLQFSRIDGKGVELADKAGLDVGVLSAEDSKNVRERMQKLELEDIYLGIDEKNSIYKKIKSNRNLRDRNICFCGDDVQDIPVMKKAGLSVCPSDARSDVKPYCDKVLNTKSGDHFVREICDLMI